MVFEDHVYKRVRTNKNGKIFWRCVMIHKGCPAYCLVADAEIDIVNVHSHLPPKYRTVTGRWRLQETDSGSDDNR